MPDWMLDGETVPHDWDVSEYIGFIYEIVYDDDTRYVGKKNFWSINELTVLKTEKPRDGHIEFVGRRKGGKNVKMERVRKETSWRTYTGSSAYTNGKKIAKREILQLCETKIDMTYWETHHLVNNNVLFDDNYLNQNVLGKFYSGQLTGSKEYVKEK